MIAAQMHSMERLTKPSGSLALQTSGAEPLGVSGFSSNGSAGSLDGAFRVPSRMGPERATRNHFLSGALGFTFVSGRI